MQKAAIIAASLFVIALTNISSAQARPFTQEMDCGRVANIVSSNGAIVMDTSPNTYDRFVSSGAFCTPQEYTKPAYVPTANNPACFIGYTCEQKTGRDKF